jgi:hypothetical protein
MLGTNAPRTHASYSDVFTRESSPRSPDASRPTARVMRHSNARPPDRVKLPLTISISPVPATYSRTQL